VVEVSGGVLVFWWCCDLRGMGQGKVRVLACYLRYLTGLMGRWKLICTKRSERHFSHDFHLRLVSPSIVLVLPLRNANIVGQRFERMQCHSQVPRPRLRNCRRKK
jgi:hypothetical protein